ncbi:MAG: hypothetical protein H6Q04_3505 [Acidobacteria bacterium]|nr:hypothetical protein [Acidobacteriota bacterium]
MKLTKWTLVALAFCFMSMLFVQPASAAAFLDFNMDAVHPDTASISFAGGDNPLIGVDISVDEVVGIGTPGNDGVVIDIVNGVLAFQTGNLVSSTASTWVFDGGGTITVTGDIGNGPVTLISGQFTSASVTAAGDTFKVTIATFVDTKDPDLVEFYGFDPAIIPGWNGNFNLSFAADGLPPGAFQSGDVLSGDIVNTPVPEPGSLLLLGTGLIAAYGFIRRRK